MLVWRRAQILWHCHHHLQQRSNKNEDPGDNTISHHTRLRRIHKLPGTFNASKTLGGISSSPFASQLLCYMNIAEKESIRKFVRDHTCLSNGVTARGCRYCRLSGHTAVTSIVQKTIHSPGRYGFPTNSAHRLFTFATVHLAQTSASCEWDHGSNQSSWLHLKMPV